MVKKRKPILKRETITFNGKEIEVDTFSVKITIGSGKELESIDEVLEQEKIEKTIQEEMKKIEQIAKGYPNKKNNIWYCYDVGKVLQFVDKIGITDRKEGVWQRMACDLRPDLFGGIGKNRKEAKRYTENMYILGKVPKEFISMATFDQWYEIVKFKNIYQDKALLSKILKFCDQGLKGPQLRQKIKELRMSSP